MAHRAVLFDLGGVVLDSPLHAIARFERDRDIPENFINRVVMDTAPGGAWSRLERGELPLPEFIPAFEADCRAAGRQIDAAAMMAAIGETAGPRPAMLRAIDVLRGRGLVVAALTNNWIPEAERSNGASELSSRFDHFIESSVEGLRKPDPRIYELALSRVGVGARQTIFLDDIGANLKPARTMGLTTIKVVEPGAALAELSSLVGFSLA